MFKMADTRVKTVKTKTTIVRRFANEIMMYQRDSDIQKESVLKLRDIKADEHDIKKQEEAYSESITLIPECRKRLVFAHTELKALLVETEKDLHDTDEYKTALSVLADTEKIAFSR